MGKENRASFRVGLMGEAHSVFEVALPSEYARILGLHRIVQLRQAHHPALAQNVQHGEARPRHGLPLRLGEAKLGACARCTECGVDTRAQEAPAMPRRVRKLLIAR